MVGTTRYRDVYQPGLQHAGKHRSGRLFPVAQPQGHHTLLLQIGRSPVTHFPLLLICWWYSMNCKRGYALSVYNALGQEEAK